MKKIQDFTNNKVSMQNQKMIIGCDLVETFMRDDMRDWWDDVNGDGLINSGDIICFEEK